MKMIGIEQKGWRCRIGDHEGSVWASREATRIAKRYRGAQMLSDIDIQTGEFVYRVEMPESSYVEYAVRLRNRRKRRAKR